MSLQPGIRLGPYEILSPLGAGGMGEVWKARDTRLDRFVAVKVLPEHLAKSPESLARFEREAKAVAALNHPNITGIFDIGNTDGVAFVAMELLEGESLRTRLEQGPLTPKKATELAIQMAQGLAAAHEKGVVHRDLKPDNLWITKEGRLKILDFGLAKQLPTMGVGSDSFVPTAAIQAGHNTEQGMILGTLGYMSPEQVRGKAVDARSDLFSFGVVLFEMLTGKRAFARDTASDTMAAILRDDPPEIEGTSRPIPLALRRIIDHCLEKAPARRFQDARDVAFALESLSSPETVAPITAPFAPQNRRTTWIWAALAAVIVVCAALGSWLL
ncbi:MAG TPA: serine/threonine-protein kinase, partial [Geothrix sp.]